MKKTKLLAALAAGALALLAAGCDNGFRDAALNAMLNNATQKSEPAEGITLDRETLGLAPGEKRKLTAAAPDNKTVEWSSSDDEVATVDDDGMVTAVAFGTATVTARAGDKKATCEVNVHDHTYSGGKCTVCGSVPYMADATIDGNGRLTKYTGNAATVEIPYGVTSIGEGAFSGCASLTEVKIPDSVTYIGYHAFYGCTSLTEVKIPDGVTQIVWNTFRGCTSLKEVTIPKSVTYIIDYAFDGCSGLERVNYTGSLADWCGIRLYGITVNPLSQGNAVLYIDGEPVTDVVIPGDVTEIKDYTFCGYKSLASLEIHENVTSIGSAAFYGCSNLETVTYTGTLAQWCAMDNDYYLMNNAQSVTVEGTDLKSMATLEIPNGVERIGDYAFSGCSGLTSVTIPEGVTSIGGGAFRECSGLETVTYTGTLAQWCAMNNDWSLLDNAQSVTVEGTDLKSMTTLVIPDDVTEIKDYAFYGCSGLTSVTIGDSVTSIGEGAFKSCTSLTSVTIGEGVKSIGGSAFSGCSGLTEVTIPGSVGNIGNSNDWTGAFEDCTNLKSVTIGEGVKSIGRYAFSSCSGLTSVTIPDSVTSIGYDAFYWCSSLTTITYGGTTAQWTAIEKGYSWDSNTGDYTITCTDGTVSKDGTVTN